MMRPLQAMRSGSPFARIGVDRPRESVDSPDMVGQRSATSRSVATATRRGTALVAMLIALMLCGMMVLAIVTAQSREQDALRDRISGVRAFYAAEGVANMAIREWALNADQDGDGTVGRIASGVTASGPSIGGGRAAANTVGTTTSTTVTVASAAADASRSVTFSLRRTSTDTVPGLSVRTYNTGCPGATTNFNWDSAPIRVGLAQNIDLPYTNSPIVRWPGAITSGYGFRHTGTIMIPAEGSWTFTTNSDDGSRLWINGTLVVNNDGDHSPQTRSGTVWLPAGPASIETRFYECNGESVMQLLWRGPGVASNTIVPASAFTTTPPTTIPGVAAHTSITLSNNTIVDSYNSAIGAYGGANVLSTANVSVNSTASNAFRMDSFAQIRGNAQVGPGGNTSTALSVTNSATVTGTRTALATAIGSPQVGLPASPPASIGSLSVDSGTYQVSSNLRVSSLAVNNSASLNVTAPVFIIVDGPVTLSSNAVVSIAPGATLTLYVSGSVSLNNQSVFHSGAPSSVRIFFIGSGQALTLSSTARLSALVANARGNVTLSNDSEFFGTLICDSLNMDSSARLHVDMSAVTWGGGTGTGATVTSWTQGP